MDISRSFFLCVNVNVNNIKVYFDDLSLSKVKSAAPRDLRQ